MTTWHLVTAGMAGDCSPRSAIGNAPAQTIGSWRRGLSAICRMVAHWRRARALLEIPQAAGASDRELARLGPDHMKRLAEQLRYSHPQRLHLMIAPYK